MCSALKPLLKTAHHNLHSFSGRSKKFGPPVSSLKIVLEDVVFLLRMPDWSELLILPLEGIPRLETGRLKPIDQYKMHLSL